MTIWIYLGIGLGVFCFLVVTDEGLPEGWWHDWSFLAAMVCVVALWWLVLVMMLRRRR